ncbi:hypothetical protein [Oceanobacillus salinisoli]|uniref:hypothetical protein n=1 Tax=Oceanobacillus salinisoli TaxID=2678611 RepID=UPI0012E14AE8|nr:hypothetical protein [Oceanobacillus salinisoli]
MKPVNYDFNDVQTALANKIASLELQLANELAAKQAIVKYAEELEKEVEELKKESAK